MANEFTLPGDLSKLADLQKQLADLTSSLGILPGLSQTVCQVASQAFCAISLAESQAEIKINLNKTDWELILSMTYPTDSAPAPLGLDKSLFSPPCRKTTFENKENRSTLTAFWEI